MAIDTIGQDWLLTNDNSILLERTQEVSEFPDPNSLYALYRVIVHKEVTHKMVEYPFMAFRGRSRDDYASTPDEGRAEWKNYSFWISTLVSFLNCPSLVEYNSDTERTVQLTNFGEYLFPHLMKIFANLYRQNDALREVVAAYQAPKK